MEKLNKTDDLINEKEFLISYLPDSAAYKKEEEYKRHLASAVDNSTDTIVSESLDGTIQSWNKGGEKMFGYAAKEAIEKNISFIISANCIKDEKKISERILQNKNIDQYETVRRKKNGKQISVSLTLSPLKDAAGNITSVSKIARDITPRKKIEEALIISNKQNLN